ncbi:hypothetical protein CFAM422_005812 [Trichoderma lentiforme]|uniref:Uncharacterized protein n=1 Tax=Trichoderma lentiforme TaxID=1567552 RepID=A0A9P4XDM8_9HYPO|nr:hypothetical protein CFAM422_005812 [Trichoderma lentiforme]
MFSIPQNAQAQRATASFIFLPDMKSSGRKLLYEIEQATKPYTLASIMGQARYVMCDLPFYDLRETAGTNQGAVHDPAMASRWFLTDNPVGTDETATASQWKDLSICINTIKTVVMTEAAIVGRENVFLVGFGIGFAAATAFLMQSEERLGGLLGVHPVIPFYRDFKYIAMEGQTKAVMNALWKMPKKDETSSEEDEANSEASSVTLDVDPGYVQTHEARRARLMGFFQYLATRWDAPTHKKYIDRTDASTPVVLIHGLDDEQISFRHAKLAVQAFWELGYKAKLKIMDGEGHTLTRNLIGELFNRFMMQNLGNEAVRAQLGTLLSEGIFERWCNEC